MRPPLALIAAPAPLLLLLLLVPAPARAQEGDPIPPDVACKEEKATCREGCSLDYGLSERTRAKVPKCLADCEQAEVICLARFVAKRHAGQAKANRERYAQPEGEPAGTPPMDEDLPPVRRRTSTRASELRPAPDRDPASYEEKVYSDPVPETPAPAPAKEVRPAPEPDLGASPPPKAVKRKKRKAAPAGGYAR